MADIIDGKYNVEIKQQLGHQKNGLKMLVLIPVGQ